MRFALILVALFATSFASDSYRHVFAQEWPGSVCKFQNCQHKYMGRFDARRWNIHGLWPDTIVDGSCGQISTCTGEKFNPNLLSADTNALVNLTWNGMYNDTDDFRKHEWEKHGTCYVPKKNQNSFFAMVAGLGLSYNMYEILAKQGIYPNNERLLTYNDLRAAMEPLIGEGASFTYMCSKDGDGNFYLSELRICFTEAMEPHTCVCRKSLIQQFVSCGSKFYYPTYE